MICRVKLPVNIIFIMIFVVPFLFPGEAQATIALSGGQWSTTFQSSCSYAQNTGTNQNVCDGLEDNGNYPYSCDGFLSTLTTSANYSGGGGGKGFRLRLCAGVNSQTAGPQMNFSPAIGEFWMRWYMRYSAGLSWSAFEYQKIIALGGAYGHGGPVGWIDSQVGRMLELYNDSRWFNQTVTPYVTHTSLMGNPSDGSWHFYEIHVKPGTSGVFQAWVDGKLVNNHTGVNYGSDTALNWISWFVNQSTIGTAGYLDVDDIKISTNGYIGPYTGGGGDTTAPTVPANLTATAFSSSQINLTWTASTDAVGVAGYNVYRGGTLIGTSATTSYSDTGLAATTSYTYTVSAYDAAGNTSAQSSSASATTQVAPAQTILLFEGWESGNTLNWRADYVAGATTVISSPVYAGTYAVRMVSQDPGNYAYAFGDSMLRSGGPTTQVTDFTLEEYYRPGAFDATGLKMWIVNAFEDWNANYVLAEGQSKPHTWAPYYMTIYLNGSGQMIGQQVRADGLPGAATGVLWRDFPQNVGSPVSLQLNAWNKIKFRVKLNTPGVSDGIFQMWINDVLKADYSTMNFRGSYTTKGWNHLMMSMHANTGLPTNTNLYRDNITLWSGGPGGSRIPSTMTDINVR